MSEDKQSESGETEMATQVLCRTIRPGDTYGQYGISKEEIIEVEPASYVVEHEREGTNDYEHIRELHVWFETELA